VTVQTQTSDALVDFHVPMEVKETWENAAELSGCSLTDIIIAATSEMAADIIDRHKFIRVSQAGMEQLMEDLQNPPEPNEALKRLMKSYKDAVENGELVIRH